MITGADGFVGTHVMGALLSLVEGVEIIPTSWRGGHSPVAGRIESLDVTDRGGVADIVARIGPTHVIHLAGIAALPTAAADPDAAWCIHVGGTLNVARAIMVCAPECLLIHAGSGQVYGTSANSGLPIDEAALLTPTDTYTASKAAADLALGALARSGLRCVRFRPFNHIGPGQSEDFFVGSFAAQIARIEAGQRASVVKVGNLEARRDFLDVRDVASAYTLAVLRGEIIPSGTILNLASGVGRRVGDVADTLLALSEVPIVVEVDESRLRPIDIPIFVGNAGKAQELLHWQPQFSLEQTLRDTLEAARQRVTSAGLC
jgi:GDP-4-dehydro-6-deoxy-D-mannose reductase